MILGTKARYAVMAMVELSGHSGEHPVTLAELAKNQEITVPYLEQLFSKLKKSGLISSVRGPGGGYILARPAQAISVLAIVEAADESIKMTRCDRSGSSGCMANQSRCLTHDVWEGLDLHIRQYLGSISLGDIHERKLPFIAPAIGNSSTASS